MSSKTKKNTKSKTDSILRLYTFFHIVLIIYAIIVSYRCNKGFNLIHMGLAIMCPHLYLFYIAATKGAGFCLLTTSESYDEVGEE